jgi:hypothetical protein
MLIYRLYNIISTLKYYENLDIKLLQYLIYNIILKTFWNIFIHYVINVCLKKYIY